VAVSASGKRIWAFLEFTSYIRPHVGPFSAEFAAVVLDTTGIFLAFK
jgi:hypothetical protein